MILLLWVYSKDTLAKYEKIYVCDYLSECNEAMDTYLLIWKPKEPASVKHT